MKTETTKTETKKRRSSIMRFFRKQFRISVCPTCDNHPEMFDGSIFCRFCGSKIQHGEDWPQLGDVTGKGVEPKMRSWFYVGTGKPCHFDAIVIDDNTEKYQTTMGDAYECPDCKRPVIYSDHNHCPECGRKIIWRLEK